MMSPELKEIAMNRRTFLRGAASLPALAVSSRVAGFVAAAGAQQKEFLSSGKLRFILPCHFEVITLRQSETLP